MPRRRAPSHRRHLRPTERAAAASRRPATTAALAAPLVAFLLLTAPPAEGSPAPAAAAAGDEAAAPPASGTGPDHRPPADPDRGIVYRGLRRPASSPCPPGLYELRDDRDAFRGCTHGPDPAPNGVEVGEPVALAEMPAPEATPVPVCDGDGVSGNRVQLIYGYPADATDRYDAIAPLIQGWAASNLEDVFSDSAADTGGTRHVRFVHDAACQPVVTKFQFSSTGDDTFSNTITELRAAGFTSHQRKYVVWMDVPGPYCGIGQAISDDEPGSENLSNGHASVQGLIARTDAPCWGLSSTPVEAHELAHTMGAVQPSAPHTTSVFPWPAGFHCTDEFDVMCYDDDGSGPATMVVACPSATDRLLDCNHDDYFSTDPPSGSYLDTAWNLADSSFLTDTDAGTTHTLTVAATGSGAGTVTSMPTGIACPGDCTEVYADGESVTLSTSAVSGSVFAGWSGACSGTGSCDVSMTLDRSVTATFTEAPAVAVTIAKKPAGLPFTVTWADARPAGFVFDVKYRVGLGSWKNWKTDAVALSGVFGKSGKPVSVRDGKTYTFKGRWQYGSTKGPWSATESFSP